MIISKVIYTPIRPNIEDGINVISSAPVGYSVELNSNEYTTESTATFNPDEIPDLTSWLAMDGSTLRDSLGNPTTTDGAIIDRVDESLASNPIAAYWRLSNYPFRASHLGHPAVQFTSSYVRTARLSDNTETPVTTQDEVTIFVVYAHNLTSRFAWMFSTSHYFNANAGYPMLHGGESTAYLGGAWNNVGSQDYNQAASPVPVNTITVQTLRSAGSGGLLESYIDGALEDSMALPAGVYWEASSFAGFGALSQNGFTDQIWIYETLVYDRRLTDAEMLTVHDGLKSKYGIT